MNLKILCKSSSSVSHRTLSKSCSDSATNFAVIAISCMAITRNIHITGRAENEETNISKFSAISKSKEDMNILLWNCGQPTNARGGTFTNLEEWSPLDEAGHHHQQLITSPTSDVRHWRHQFIPIILKRSTDMHL
jgi:hypothetical protein